jgi:hypothetical protein
MFIQLLSIAGALLVLGAYAAQQLKRLDPESVAYLLMNLFGGIFLCVSALTTKQLGLILIEAAWALVSAGGLVGALRRRATASR